MEEVPEIARQRGSDVGQSKRGELDPTVDDRRRQELQKDFSFRLILPKIIGQRRL